MNDLFSIWPSLLMGLAVPLGVIIALFFNKKRGSTSFQSVLYGFGTFIFSLLLVAVLLLFFSELFLSSVTLSGDDNTDAYIIIGGSVILFLFYLISEFLKQISFYAVLKTEKKNMAGLSFGCGFVIAQNLLIFGLAYISEIDVTQALFFGLLMLISGIIYILLSALNYQLVEEKHRIAGSAISFLYYLMYAVMLIFANVYVTYSFCGVVLLLTLGASYLILPLPFKKQIGGEKR